MVDPEGHFLQAHSEERKGSLRDDDRKYLLLSLHIVHLQLHKVLQVLPTDNLFEMVVLCDKYDTVRVVRPASHQLSALTLYCCLTCETRL